MDLKSRVRRGKRKLPPKLTIMGPPGIGKSTFAADAPNPLFVSAEEGVDHIDTSSVTPESWRDMMEILKVVEGEDEFESVIVDTVDAAYNYLLGPHVVAEKGMKGGIDEQDFGRGHAAALAPWREFLSRLDQVRKSGKNVILLAHTQIKAFNDPEGENYDRYTLRLPEKAGGLVLEWSEAVLFANYQVKVVKSSKGSPKGKGELLGRFLFTERTAAYDAKNRYSLPEKLPLEWHALSAAMEGFDIDTLFAKAAEKEPEKVQKLKDWLDRAVDRRAAEAQAVTRLEEMING